MANEPERPIETLLRAAAKKRRDEAGAPFELHPADRRRLQGEVARRFARPRPEPRSFATLLRQWWLRSAWGVGILAILGLSAWLLLVPPGKGKPETSLASNRLVTETLPSREFAPAAALAANATPTPPAPELEPKSAEVAYAETPPGAPSGPASPPGATASPTLAKVTVAAQGELKARDRFALAASAQPGDQKKAAQWQAGVSSGTPPPSSAGTLGVSLAARYELAAKAQRFVQAAPAPTAQAVFADQSKPAHPVLASFQVEQTGSHLRIVDGDGSVYSGYVQAATTARRAPSARAAATAAAPASRVPLDGLEPEKAAGLYSKRPASQTYSFRVAGTNRSLNQSIVFTGNLLTATNLASSLSAATNLSIGGGLGGSPNAPAPLGLLPLLNLQISGKVVIGSGNAVEINALPATP